MGTAQASGIAMVAAARRGLPVALHTRARSRPRSPAADAPTRPRSAAMVTRILRLDAPPKPADAADALALAITHIWRGGAQARLDAAVVAAAARAQESVIAFVRGQVAAVTRSPAPSSRSGGVGLELMRTPNTLATLRPGRPPRCPRAWSSARTP